MAYPGTYSGVIEKIPHLRRMGFNAVELLPIQEFNEARFCGLLSVYIRRTCLFFLWEEGLSSLCACCTLGTDEAAPLLPPWDPATAHLAQCEYFAPVNPATGGVYCNFWGFSPVGYMAPMARFSANPNDDCGRGVVREARSPPPPSPRSSLLHRNAPPLPRNIQRVSANPRNEYHVAQVKEMVKALHEAGIEVIANMVLSHSAEGNEQGPTISFRGLDNQVYYMASVSAALSPRSDASRRRPLTCLTTLLSSTPDAPR